MNKEVKPIAFVIPWYGDNIKGGAESECNQLAHCIQEAGYPVEVLTTCVREASDDRGINTLPEGESIESGILVKRFPVCPRDERKYMPVNLKLYRNESVTEKEELLYFQEDINSPKLYSYIRNNKNSYEIFIFIPYLYGITYFGLAECEEKAMLIPCLHDEGYAYMQLMKRRMEHVGKIAFLSQPEADLANSLYDLRCSKTEVLGAYVESGWEKNVCPSRFQKKYGITGAYILCAGRKEPGKKTDMLLSYFSKYVRRNPNTELKLVFIGGGKIDIPSKMKNTVFDLGFIDIQDKYDAYAAAFLLCNPSFFESFSIVIMESWLAQRPVLVSEQCKVTSNFCVESNGGLYFDSYLTFEKCLNYLLEHKDIADKMGCNGYDYVQSHFVKNVIQEKYIDFIFN